jgi:hypothetical protein
VSEYKSAVGPIPDEWFENDTDPTAGKKMEPKGFYEKFKASLQEPPEPQPQSSPKSPSSDREPTPAR